VTLPGTGPLRSTRLPEADGLDRSRRPVVLGYEGGGEVRTAGLDLGSPARPMLRQQRVDSVDLPHRSPIANRKRLDAIITQMDKISADAGEILLRNQRANPP